MKKSKKETFIFNGLGFPIKLINAPMKKMLGEWVLDVDMNELMRVVIEGLIKQPYALTGAQLRFIRSYLEMTTEKFGKLCGVSHSAVLHWENERNAITPALDGFIRMRLQDLLKTSDSEFRKFFKKLDLGQLSIHKSLQMSVDASEGRIKVVNE
jgi:DNA-binding transcriptional regulator YiaG